MILALAASVQGSPLAHAHISVHSLQTLPGAREFYFHQHRYQAQLDIGFGSLTYGSSSTSVKSPASSVGGPAQTDGASRALLTWFDLDSLVESMHVQTVPGVALGLEYLDSKVA
jgi:hypothetical protein